VYRQILIGAKLETGKTVQKTELNAEVHYGGEGPQWNLVPSKKRKTKFFSAFFSND
jgi:hypothetical protein